uniref:UBX domain-containing protein 11 n=1 Tax=Salarias fasciatus TaxID=181472 RepID=A0A672GCP8_SALFA
QLSFMLQNFLSDYGLIWVGDAEKEGSSEDEQILDPPQRGSVTSADPHGSFLVNFDLVVQSIRELNILAGEGESFVRTTAGRAQLAQKEPIQLSLYSNGILMFDGPFRSYRDLSTQQCVTDLMDGYFPSELQDRFPDGAPFEVHDRADQFLDKLPKVVVKRGRVIKIREPIRAMLQNTSLNKFFFIFCFISRSLASTGSHQSPLNDIITLKVRSEDGDQVYIVKMRLSETVGHLRNFRLSFRCRLSDFSTFQRTGFSTCVRYHQCPPPAAVRRRTHTSVVRTDDKHHSAAAKEAGGRSLTEAKESNKHWF